MEHQRARDLQGSWITEVDFLAMDRYHRMSAQKAATIPCTAVFVEKPEKMRPATSEEVPCDKDASFGLEYVVEKTHLEAFRQGPE